MFSHQINNFQPSRELPGGLDWQTLRLLHPVHNPGSSQAPHRPRSHAPTSSYVLSEICVPFHRRLPRTVRFCGQQRRCCFSFHLAPLRPPAKESALAAAAVAKPIWRSLDHFLSQPRHLDLWLVQLIAFWQGCKQLRS